MSETEGQKKVETKELPRRERPSKEAMQEYFVKEETHKLIRRELALCYFKERVNQLTKCAPLAREYLIKVLGKKEDEIPQLASKPSPPPQQE
jgi:hypothetical protein